MKIPGVEQHNSNNKITVCVCSRGCLEVPVVAEREGARQLDEESRVSGPGLRVAGEDPGR